MTILCIIKLTPYRLNFPCEITGMYATNASAYNAALSKNIPRTRQYLLKPGRPPREMTRQIIIREERTVFARVEE
jgi:hypothetical protein